jgi:hypothetical protein
VASDKVQVKDNVITNADDGQCGVIEIPEELGGCGVINDVTMTYI